MQTRSCSPSSSDSSSPAAPSSRGGGGAFASSPQMNTYYLPNEDDEEDEEKGQGQEEVAAAGSELQTIECEWNDCGELFWELEPLIKHLHTQHTHPLNAAEGGGTGRKAGIYACDWVGCARRGNQSSRFALVAHLKSHSGEKAFDCTRAECDKAFTRTDALQKHMRLVHHEAIPTVTRRTTSSTTATTTTTSSKKRARASSIASNDDDSHHGGVAIAGKDVDDNNQDEDAAEIVYSQEEIATIQRFENDVNPHLVAYVVLKAKVGSAIREHEEMLFELEALERREKELEGQNHKLLRLIMEKESADSNRVELDTLFAEI